MAPPYGVNTNYSYLTIIIIIKMWFKERGDLLSTIHESHLHKQGVKINYCT